VGGTNAHVILHDAPGDPDSVDDAPSAGEHLLPISARSQEALRVLMRTYLDLLANEGDVHDLCYSAARRRAHLPLRVAVTGDSAEALRTRLLERLSELPRTGSVSERKEETIALRYERGEHIDWAELYPRGRFIPLPNYPWQRERYWFTQPPAPSAAPAASSDCVYRLEWTPVEGAAPSRVARCDVRDVERAAQGAA
jgi:acyl transferase domain-containing protein